MPVAKHNDEPLLTRTVRNLHKRECECTDREAENEQPMAKKAEWRYPVIEPATIQPDVIANTTANEK